MENSLVTLIKGFNFKILKHFLSIDPLVKPGNLFYKKKFLGSIFFFCSTFNKVSKEITLKYLFKLKNFLNIFQRIFYPFKHEICENMYFKNGIVKLIKS